MGDLVQATALLRTLHRRWGRPCDLVCGFAGARELLAGVPSIRSIVLVSSRRAPYWLDASQRQLVAWLRARDRSPVWLYEPMRRPARKLGWLLRRGGVAPSDVVSSESLDRPLLEHTVDYLRRLARRGPVGFPSVDRGDPSSEELVPALRVSGSEVDDGRAWLRARGWPGGALTVVHAVSRKRARGRWPAARWVATFGEILRRDPDARIVLAGSRRERRELAALAAAARDRRVIVGAGALSIGRLKGLLCLADNAICLDSGVAHVAAALECPVTVLFGTADPRRVSPRGRAPVILLSSIARADWPASPYEWRRSNRLADIPVEQVLEAWQATASGRSRPGSEPRGFELAEEP
jgi:heptosyltransferase-2/heptosyltransferase-3